MDERGAESLSEDEYARAFAAAGALCAAGQDTSLAADADTSPYLQALLGASKDGVLEWRSEWLRLSGIRSAMVGVLWGVLGFVLWVVFGCGCGLCVVCCVCCVFGCGFCCLFC